MEGLRNSERSTWGPCVAAESMAAAGQREVMAMLVRPSRVKSTERPIVRADTAGVLAFWVERLEELDSCALHCTRSK